MLADSQFVIFIGFFPVYDAPEGIDVIRPPVLVFEIVGMLPYIQT
jgi:hypothetical protein